MTSRRLRCGGGGCDESPDAARRSSGGPEWRRLRDPTKQWKFNPGDLEERKLWSEYVEAYEDALTLCNTEHAPWYVIPANHKWYRNLVVSQLLCEVLGKLDLRYPEPPAGIEKYVIPD